MRMKLIPGPLFSQEGLVTRLVQYWLFTVIIKSKTIIIQSHYIDILISKTHLTLELDIFSSDPIF